MTKDTANTNKKRKRAAKLYSARGAFFCLVSLFSLFIIIKNSSLAIKYMSEGLTLCAKTVIPSLFPFMVISDIIVTSGVASLFGRALQAPMRLLFGIGGEGGCALLLGTLCGFPIGARSAVSLYDSGKISKAELERLLTFTNNPSSAFIVSAVGISLFGSHDFGVALYVITLLSSLIIGLSQNLFFSPKNKNQTKKESLSRSKLPALSVKDFTSSITDSAFGILRICAFVVFFTAFVGTLGSLSDSISLSQTSKALLFGAFELTGGVSQASLVTPTEKAALIAAAVVGWSGISVHFQIMSLCSDRGISFKPYFAAKLFQSALCILMMKLYILFFNPDFLFHTESVSLTKNDTLTNSLVPVIFSLFCLVILFGISKKICKKRSHKKKD